tara:strand:+ start:617 stop:841 length:225 start_codon:yes stop_codon:yes gene_type:complete
MDSLIKFENLEENFHEVCPRLMIPQTPLEFINVAKKKNYVDFYKKGGKYDDRLIEKVATIYSQDVEAGNYKFGE